MTMKRLTKSSPVINVKVEQEVIDTASVRDSSHCMIADAIARQVPNARFISVDLATIRFTDPIAGRRYIYLTPRSAQEALLDFDQGKKVEPFGFRISGAHVMATGSANKARASLESPGGHSSNQSVPERRDGDSPPIGPLAAGSPRRRRGEANEGAGHPAVSRTGRRREFGLRAIIR